MASSEEASIRNTISTSTEDEENVQLAPTVPRQQVPTEGWKERLRGLSSRSVPNPLGAVATV